ncbi:MAG: extracellular solute-binding protein, partial [Rhodospirillaceae bacterium]
WIPYLMGYGGSVFKNPPENLTPTFASPEGIKAADWYANLLTKYGPDGQLSYSDDQAMRAQMSGRANMRTQAITWGVPLVKDPESKVAKTTRFGLMPAGPKGNFPGSNSHGLGIPAGSKKKEAAWEFIKWALSKEMINRIVEKHGYPSVCRTSVIKSPKFKEVMTLNGQDVAALYLEVLQLGGKTGYMKYRTVPVYPQVGDKINRAIDKIATKQQAAPEAMKQAQAEAVQDLKKAGFKVDQG